MPETKYTRPILDAAMQALFRDTSVSACEEDHTFLSTGSFCHIVGAFFTAPTKRSVLTKKLLIIKLSRDTSKSVRGRVLYNVY
jgi:hypothetical protein